MRPSRSTHEQAVVERLEDVLVELAQPIELAGLTCSCRYRRPFSSAVATCPATAPSSAMSSLLSGSPSRCGRARAPRSCLPSRRTARSRYRPQSRQNSISSSENRRGRQRIVERDDVPGFQRGRRCPNAARAPAASSRSRDAQRREVAGGLVGEDQRHPVDQQRLHRRASRAARRGDRDRGRCSDRARSRPARAGSRSDRDRTRDRARSESRSSPGWPAARRRASRGSRSPSCCPLPPR